MVAWLVEAEDSVQQSSVGRLPNGGLRFDQVVLQGNRLFRHMTEDVAILEDQIDRAHRAHVEFARSRTLIPLRWVMQERVTVKSLGDETSVTSWSQLPSPADATESLTSLGVTGSETNLTVVGDRESGTAPYTTEVASGSPSSLSLVNSPNNSGDENDLFGATTAPDGSVYAVGWAADPSTGNYASLIEHEVNGQWSIDTTPNPGSSANGFAGVTAIPGGGVWGVGVFTNKGNNATFIAHHC
jgi:hypothetical protein